MSIVVGKAGTSDAAEVAQTLAQAFFDDPVFRWWIPADGRRRQILPAFFAAATNSFLPGDELYRAADGTGAAVWSPPGRPTQAEQEAAGPLIAAAVAEFVGPLAEIEAATGALHPAEPHFYLFLLGVRPGAQGRGLGTGLLRTVLDRCDATGTPAYLEATSEHNRRLYERHGFVAREAVTVRDSPPLWLMWREPSAPPETMGT